MSRILKLVLRSHQNVHKKSQNVIFFKTPYYRPLDLLGRLRATAIDLHFSVSERMDSAARRRKRKPPKRKPKDLREKVEKNRTEGAIFWGVCTIVKYKANPYFLSETFGFLFRGGFPFCERANGFRSGPDAEMKINCGRPKGLPGVFLGRN